MNKRKERVLVIAAHPDDELLGCGGVVRLHIEQGDEVCSVITCEGESLRYGIDGVGQSNHMIAANDCLGVSDVRCLGFPDQKLDQFTLTDIITKLESVVQDIQPSIVYTQYGGDINRDHELLFKAMLVATRPTEGCIRAIYAFDTASSTEWAYPRSFIPDTWVDISSVLDTKLLAFSKYESELRDYPHPRSVEGVRNKALAWGNQCCLEAAEVFMTIRRRHTDGETPL